MGRFSQPLTKKQLSGLANALKIETSHPEFTRLAKGIQIAHMLELDKPKRRSKKYELDRLEAFSKAIKSLRKKMLDLPAGESLDLGILIALQKYSRPMGGHKKSTLSEVLCDLRYNHIMLPENELALNGLDFILVMLSRFIEDQKKEVDTNDGELVEPARHPHQTSLGILANVFSHNKSRWRISSKTNPPSHFYLYCKFFLNEFTEKTYQDPFVQVDRVVKNFKIASVKPAKKIDRPWGYPLGGIPTD